MKFEGSSNQGICAVPVRRCIPQNRWWRATIWRDRAEAISKWAPSIQEEGSPPKPRQARATYVDQSTGNRAGKRKAIEKAMIESPKCQGKKTKIADTLPDKNSPFAGG